MRASRTRWPRFPGMKDTVLVAGSLSKTYAMTGWRIGFVLAPAPIIGGIVKLQSHSTSNPTSIAQKAAIEALCGPQDSVTIMLAEYKKRRDYVIARLRQIPGVQANMPQGAFYAYPNVSAAFPRRNRELASVRREAPGRRACRGRARRSFRDARSRPHLLRDFDEGAGARPRPHPQVHRRARLSRPCIG